MEELVYKTAVDCLGPSYGKYMPVDFSHIDLSCCNLDGPSYGSSLRNLSCSLHSLVEHFQTLTRQSLILRFSLSWTLLTVCVELGDQLRWNGLPSFFLPSDLETMAYPPLFSTRASHPRETAVRKLSQGTLPSREDVLSLAERGKSGAPVYFPVCVPVHIQDPGWCGVKS